ncbi:MAG TPA: AsmA-like C-terminal domain-containing protein [Alphaproteobacteria bacterium]|nr:AsmA-like C-terminal domain-containing protein [Alphaproteobacteria bacterium]
MKTNNPLKPIKKLAEQKLIKPVRRNLALLVPHVCMLWIGRVFALLMLVIVTGVVGGVLWLQQAHPITKPVSLSGWLPSIEKMLGDGAKLSASGLEMFYDKGIVLRASDLRLRGGDGTLAVVIEQAAVRFSRSSLFRFKIAPRTVEAQNVTLRVVRDENEISIAGLNVGGAAAKPSKGLGVVGFLNGMGANDTWGWLSSVKVTGLTLLLRDNVQNTDWIMQDATVDLGKTDDGGEHGSLVAEVRRRAADGHERRLPVLVTFDHAEDADTAEIRARFGSADVDLIADYLPKPVSDLMRAEGNVEVGTTLDRNNRLGQPWITLRLRDITFTPPSEFSHSIKFDRLTLTASYQASPTDLLTLHDVEAVYKGIENIHAKGWVQGVTGPTNGRGPLVSIVAYTAGGDAQRIFDFLPDKRLDVAMPFLRKNIADARYANLVLNYNGHPGDMPYCGSACGLKLRLNIVKGKATFADALGPVGDVSGTGEMRGDALVFNIGPTKMGTAANGPQNVEGAEIQITNLFTPGPTDVIVSGTVNGPLSPLLKGLGGWLKKDMPVVSAGTHSTGISVTVPFVRGKETTPEDAMMAVDSNIRDVTLDKVEDLPLPPLQVSEGNFKIGADKMAIKAKGQMGGQNLEATLADALATFGANLKGQVVWTAPSSAKLEMNGDTLSITGKKLDLSAIDLFSTSTSESTVKNMNVSVKLEELKTREASMRNLTAEVVARAGRWEINTFTAKVDGNNQVNVISSKGADGRRKLAINIDNAGKLLRGIGAYKDLRGGQVFGEINYDSPDVASGVLQMRKFELANPPVLVRLLGMLSLTQLLAGGDSVLFDNAAIPLRFDGDNIFIDNVTMEGPSMSLRLNGVYNRATRTMNIDGQMAPAIPFNRLVGQIPLLGTLLTGGQDGVVVADFKLKGSADAPDITVRPLSVITPGLLKGIFRGLTGGSAPKPDVVDGRSKK